MDTFDLFPDFITPAEAADVVAWAVTQKSAMVDRQNLHTGGPGRRLSENIRRLRPYPAIIGEIQTRLEATLGITNTDDERLKYKLVIHETGADTENHVDAYSAQYPNFKRAAILVQEATQGGIFRVNNVPINFPLLSMLSFVGDSSHGVTNVAQGERILLRANWSV